MRCTATAFYASHIDRYQFDQPFDIAQIVVNDSVLAIYLKDLAESGYDFTTLVDEYIPEGEGLRGRYEVLGWIGPNEVDSGLYSAAKRTAVGQVSRPTLINGEWHLVKVREARQQQSLLQAKGNIVSELVRNYREAALARSLNELMARYHVTTAKKLPTFFLPPVPDRTHH